MNGNSSSGDLEIDVLMEEDDSQSSDGEDGLVCCTHKQAAGILEGYEEDGQQLPGDGNYGSDEDEEELTSKEIDIIHDVEQSALQPDDNPNDDSNDDFEGDDAIHDSSEEDNEGDSDFIPEFKLKEMKSNVFNTTGGKKHTQKAKDASYMFCPLSHCLSILHMVCKHFCQHPILCECHGQSQTPQQIHHNAVLESPWPYTYRQVYH